MSKKLSSDIADSLNTPDVSRLSNSDIVLPSGQESCPHRLPCGICELLGRDCPKHPQPWTPSCDETIYGNHIQDYPKIYCGTDNTLNKPTSGQLEDFWSNK